VIVVKDGLIVRDEQREAKRAIVLETSEEHP